MKFKLEIDMGNDAFHDCGEIEVCRILRDLTERMTLGEAVAKTTYNLRDVNGNSVGKAEFRG
jgi:hypothetical protein